MEHRNIPEDGLHEPKGVSLAAANRVYRSDGAGSGDWLQVDANTLQGNINNSTPAGRRVETDGEGGFTHVLPAGAAFGTMNLTQNTTSVSKTAATDSTLNTNSDYTALSLAFIFDSLQEMGSGSNYLLIQNSGLYVVDFWCNLRASTNDTLFGLKFVVNDTSFVARAPKERLPSSGRIHNLSANGVHPFNSGDQVKLYIATSTSTNVTIEDLTFQMLYMGVF